MKYENIANVGDRVRSYDFRGRTDCYVEGKVSYKRITGWPHYACFVVITDKVVWNGKDSPDRTGATVYVPMEILRDYDGRIVKLAG